MTDWIVVGGGFRGMVGAYGLLERGHSVTLIDPSKGLGGVLRSIEWNEFALDLGCHLFGNSGERSFKVMSDLAQGDIHPLKVDYASITDGYMTNEVAVPDFSQQPQSELQSLVWDVLEASSGDEPEAGHNQSVQQYLKRIYGATLGDSISQIATKLFRSDPRQLHCHSLSASPLQRVRIAPDKVSMALKKNARLDNVLAASSINNELQFLQNHEKTFPHKNFYPRENGMLGFCKNAELCLSGMGAKLMFGTGLAALEVDDSGVQVTLANDEVLTADRLLWCLDPKPLTKITSLTEENADIHLPVPMVVFYFLVPSDTDIGYTYLHDFSTDHLCYRISSPGVYGRQSSSDNLTYLCCECPTEIGSELWKDPDGHAETAWQELRDTGMVSIAHHSGLHLLKTPVSYKGLKLDYLDRLDSLEQELHAMGDRVIVSGLRAFAKVDIVADSDELLEKIA